MNLTKIIFFVLFLIALNSFSQTPLISTSNHVPKSGDEFLLPLSYCTDNPQNKTTCPFCDCKSLDTLIEILKKYPKSKVEISVHTDFRGSDSNNLKISKQRAASIKEYLENAGVDSKQFTATGFGEQKLFVFNNDEVIENLTIKKGTVINETFIKNISNQNIKEQLHLRNRRIIVKFLL